MPSALRVCAIACRDRIRRAYAMQVLIDMVEGDSAPVCLMLREDTY